MTCKDLGAEAAAQAGHIDDVIHLAETRPRIAGALAMTAGSERGARGRTTTIPL